VETEAKNLTWLGDDAEPELTAKEKALRDAFVREYLFDYQAVTACIRLGYKAAVAPTYAARFMDESYVQRKIKEAQRGPEGDVNSVIRSGLMREANYHGNGSSHSARVAAWTQASKIEGLDKSNSSTTNNFVLAVPKEKLESLTDEELDVMIRVMAKLEIQMQTAAESAR
jgi:hypothetical protein